MTSDSESRFARCCPGLFKQLRTKAGLTQAQLAHKSGYSERLIVKAEGGASVSRKTVIDLAGALSTTERIVHPEDLTTDPEALARRYIEAFYVDQRRLPSAIAGFMDDNPTFVVNGDQEAIPFAGEYVGSHEVQRLFDAFFDVLEVPEGHTGAEDFQYFPKGTDVGVWGSTWIHPKGVVFEEPMPISIVLRFRRGKLYFHQSYFDTKRVADLLDQLD